MRIEPEPEGLAMGRPLTLLVLLPGWPGEAGAETVCCRFEPEEWRRVDSDGGTSGSLVQAMEVRRWWWSSGLGEDVMVCGWWWLCRWWWWVGGGGDDGEELVVVVQSVSSVSAISLAT